RRTLERRRERRSRRDGRGGDVRRAADLDPHPALLDGELRDRRLLDDPDELLDPLRAVALDLRQGAVVAGGAAADRLKQRLRVVAEQAEQEELLLARGEPLGARAQLAEVGRVLLGVG